MRGLFFCPKCVQPANPNLTPLHLPSIIYLPIYLPSTQPETPRLSGEGPPPAGTFAGFPVSPGEAF
jgi:hypothetical protein